MSGPKVVPTSAMTVPTHWMERLSQFAKVQVLGSDGVSVHRKLLSTLMACTVVFALGACGFNVALGLGFPMVVFSVSLCLTGIVLWCLSRFTALHTDVLAGISVSVALMHLVGAWFTFEGGLGMAPPMAFALLCLPLVFSRSRYQMWSFGVILVAVAGLSWVDLYHPDLLAPYYDTPTDRAVDVVVSRMLGLFCCGLLLLRGTELYVRAIRRLRIAERERVALVEAQARAVAARQAEELERVRSMSRGFAHDLSNLLSVMTQNAELLEEELSMGALNRQQTLSDLEAIRTSAQAAVQLTRRLLDSRRPSRLEPRSFELTALLEEQVQLVSHLSPGVRVTFGTPPTSIRVRGRREIVEQAVLNLCLNAIQAMNGQGHITLRCVESGGRSSIEVIDDGPGISDDVLPRIFEPNFTTRRTEGGTGLGLAMVWAGVQSMGGEILVDSEEGRGTRFQILLPRCVDTHAKVA